MLENQPKTTAKIQQDLSLFLQAVDASTYDLAADEGFFATMVLLEYWTEDRKIQMIRAGQSNPVLVSQTEATEVTDRGGVSGGAETGPVGQYRVGIRPGGALLLLTEGVSDTENNKPEVLGYKQLIDCLLHLFFALYIDTFRHTFV